MKKVHSFGIIFFCCSVIFMFTNARKATMRKLREGEGAWYMKQAADSSEFFSSDTLTFVKPFLKYFDTKSEFEKYEKQIDSLNKYPVIKFGFFQNNEFQIDLNHQDTVLQNGKKSVKYNIFDGMFSIERKTGIITFTFYTFDDTKASDDIDDWIKGVAKKYRILEFSRSKLILVKMESE